MTNCSTEANCSTETNCSTDIPDPRRCPACGAANDCAIAQGSEQCWCMAEPIGAALPASIAASCYCRDCLRALSPLAPSLSESSTQ